MAMPKVISLFRQERFEDRFPEISILGEPTNLFVECMSYDVQKIGRASCRERV